MPDEENLLCDRCVGRVSIPSAGRRATSLTCMLGRIGPRISFNPLSGTPCYFTYEYRNGWELSAHGFNPLSGTPCYFTVSLSFDDLRAGIVSIPSAGRRATSRTAQNPVPWCALCFNPLSGTPCYFTLKAHAEAPTIAGFQSPQRDAVLLHGRRPQRSQ